MKAMLLAAGRGERLRPLTDQTPKPLLKVGDLALIEYHLHALAKANIREVVINIAHLAKQFPETLGDGSRYGVSIHYSFEPQAGALESGGGIFQALPLLGKNPFIVISSDIFTDYPFEHLPQQLSGLAHLILVDNPPHHPDGDFSLLEGLVIPKNTISFNFAGIGVCSPALFEGCHYGRFPLAPLLNQAIDHKQITGEHYRGRWVNVGTLEQLTALNQHGPL